MELSNASMDLLPSQAHSQASSTKTELVQSRKVQTREEARAVAEEFESVFLSTMLDTMFSGIKTDGYFGGGHAEGIYRSMLNQEYAKAITRSGGIGIADQVYAEILRTQVQQPPSAPPASSGATANKLKTQSAIKSLEGE